MRVEFDKSTAVDFMWPSRIKSVFVSATVRFVWRSQFFVKSTLNSGGPYRY